MERLIGGEGQNWAALGCHRKMMNVQAIGVCVVIGTVHADRIIWGSRVVTVNVWESVLKIGPKITRQFVTLDTTLIDTTRLALII